MPVVSFNLGVELGQLAIVGVFLFVTVPLEFLWFLFLVLDNGLNALGIAPNESAAHMIDTIQRDLISLGSVLLVLALGRRGSSASAHAWPGVGDSRSVGSQAPQ